jgi:RNA polymerase sigma factor (TIGR02999 family)
MRRILIERARRDARAKHGGGLERVPYEESGILAGEPAPELLALDEALTRLEKVDRRQAEIVKLRYFIGLTIAETAETLAVSPATIKLDWTYARAWLHAEIAKGTA